MTIEGGSVEARGGNRGAGIGGGGTEFGGVAGDGGVVTIAGGSVEVHGGGFSAAGIGGGGAGFGEAGAGGDVVVAQGAEVTAMVYFVGSSPIGAARPDLPFGSLEVAGDVYLPGGIRLNMHVPEGADFTVTETGRILGEAGDLTNGVNFLGDGQVDNRGVIALDTDLVDVDVHGHHYEVAFDTAGGEPDDIEPVTVFAESFTAGFRDFPDDPTHGDLVFSHWNTEADGTGDPVHAATALAEEPLADGDAVPVALTAQYSEFTLDSGLDNETLEIGAGQAESFVPVLLFDGEPVLPESEPWSLISTDDVVDIEFDPEAIEFTVTGESAGDYTLTLAYVDPDTGIDLQTDITVTVHPGDIDSLDAQASATKVDQGDSIVLEVTGADVFGNDVGDIDLGELRVTSSVESDEIDGLSVRFPTASEHVITVTHEPTEVSGTVTIEVTAAPVPPDDEEPETPPLGDQSAGALPATGGPAAGWIAAGLALIVTGGLALGSRMTSRRGTRT